MKKIFAILLLGGLATLVACQSKSNRKQSSYVAASDNKDYHTFSNAREVPATHLSLDINVDFATKTISGVANWTISNPKGRNKIIFDTKYLIIDSVILDGKEIAKYSLGDNDSILGQALTIDILPIHKNVAIYYKTTDKATALQWLTPDQTFGKKYPFLYTQSESIHARTWIPCQDGPGIRYTYDAKVTVPTGLMAVMSARNTQTLAKDGVYKFEMEKPIPAYLMALGVGDISFKAIDARTGVYAEPAILEKAAKEFEDVGKMVHVAEDLYGPYHWGRYDILVLPSGFPIGGMENPRLTFCTPTILAGDKSLVNLIAHELAHNWSGNLVTNKTWNDFWLNEGFTVYFERRIMEAMQGKDYADMLWEIGYQDLEATIEDLGKDSPDTHLRLSLKNRNPDEGLTDIPYEKGALLLRKIELTVGRAKFDVFLKKYFDKYAFQSMNTQEFIQYLNSELLDKNKEWREAINLNKWLYNPGIPAGAPRADHKNFDFVDNIYKTYKATEVIDVNMTKNWSTFEWMHFLRKFVTDGVTTKQMEYLDQQFKFTSGKNSEIDDLWYILSINSNYAKAYEPMKSFLMVTGRQKFLEPIYKALIKNPETKVMAKDIYKLARPNYHPITQFSIDEIVK